MKISKDMYLSDMLNALKNKIFEMDYNLNELLKSDVSENTKRTQKFQRTKEIHTMLIIKALLVRLQECNGYDTLGPKGPDALSPEVFKWFESLVTLTSERKSKYVIEVHENDRVMDIMEKYKDVKDVYKKIMKAAEDNGLKADFGKGIFIKA